jgi:hypothetical protein
MKVSPADYTIALVLPIGSTLLDFTEFNDMRYRPKAAEYRFSPVQPVWMLCEF